MRLSMRFLVRGEVEQFVLELGTPDGCESTPLPLSSMVMDLNLTERWSQVVTTITSMFDGAPARCAGQQDADQDLTTEGTDFFRITFRNVAPSGRALFLDDIVLYKVREAVIVWLAYCPAVLADKSAQLPHQFLYCRAEHSPA
ncbi:hypothetical protein CYMTET_41900 [Cymbomonas tetramitiformis]|uniref:Uncharacterized protein n=1 Tax=Cymbomonas tetramitiformis TaxID=36881 RepID=A0AAE0C6W4_9CHLO|nr:hypothetical protein CYMTET_41900 [Cymbomonas tetramitiformis]